MNAPASLSIRGIAKSFGATRVLEGLSLEVPASRLTAILGHSGCGKTTLLRLIAGFEQADAGSIRLGATTLCDEKVSLPPERRGIGYVPQEGALFPNLSVAANVGFGVPRAEKATRVGEMLELVDLPEMAKRYPHELSGGQQQRVALARALASRPGLILLDEPFDALDASLRAQVRLQVRDAIRAAGATALLVTHDQEEALSLADLVAVMRGGRTVQVAEPRTLYDDPLDAGVANFVGDAVLLEGRRAARQGFATTVLGEVALRGDESRETFTVMLRPEQILIEAVNGHAPNGRVRGRVTATTYYGHDALSTVAIDGREDVEVRARAAGNALPASGDQVTLTVQGPAVAIDPDVEAQPGFGRS